MSTIAIEPLAIEAFEGKSDKNRLIACIRGEETDRVPNFEVLIEDEHVTRLLGRQAGNTLGLGGDPAKGSETTEEMRPMYAKDYIELCKIIGQDAILVEQFWTPIKKRQDDGSVVPFNDRSFRSSADLDRVIWPDESDMEERLRYIREYVKAAKNTDIGVIFGGACIFQYIYEFMVGFENAMIMGFSVSERDLFKELMLNSALYFKELVSRVIAEGVEILFFADDFAFKSGLMYPPEVFQEIWTPYYDMILEPARNAELPIVFHSDGKIDDMIDTLIEMGINAITPLDPSGIDYKDYKKRYGNELTFFGNIDIQWPLATGTPEEVDKDVKDHMDVLKKGGRWVAGSSHSIVNYIPHENFVTMINAIHKYGRY